MALRKRTLIIGAIVIILVALVVFLLSRSGGDSKNGSNNESKAGSSASAEEMALAINPCSLLNESERATLGTGPPEENDRRDKGDLAYRECDWRSDTLHIGATIFPNGNLKNAQRWENVTPEPLTIGSHKAQIAQAPADNTSQILNMRTCQLDIQLDIGGSTSSVRLLVSVPNDISARSCDVARQAASFIEPRLP